MAADYCILLCCSHGGSGGIHAWAAAHISSMKLAVVLSTMWRDRCRSDAMRLRWQQNICVCGIGADSSALLTGSWPVCASSCMLHATKSDTPETVYQSANGQARRRRLQSDAHQKSEVDNLAGGGQTVRRSSRGSAARCAYTSTPGTSCTATAASASQNWCGNEAIHGAETLEESRFNLQTRIQQQCYRRSQGGRHKQSRAINGCSGHTNL